MAVIQRVWYIYAIDKKIRHPRAIRQNIRTGPVQRVAWQMNYLYGKPDKKNMTTINDLVLIHLEDDPVSFARVEDISPDAKKDWYQIKLLMLQVPLQVVTWILKDIYINGEEFFMNGKRMKLVKVEAPDQEPIQDDPESTEDDNDAQPTDNSDTTNSNIISFSDLKKDS